MTGYGRVTYLAPAQRSVTLIQSGTIQSHTYENRTFRVSGWVAAGAWLPVNASV